MVKTLRTVVHWRDRLALGSWFFSFTFMARQVAIRQDTTASRICLGLLILANKSWHAVYVEKVSRGRHALFS